MSVTHTYTNWCLRQSCLVSISKTCSSHIDSVRHLNVLSQWVWLRVLTPTGVYLSHIWTQFKKLLFTQCQCEAFSCFYSNECDSHSHTDTLRHAIITFHCQIMHCLCYYCCFKTPVYNVHNVCQCVQIYWYLCRKIYVIGSLLMNYVRL